MVKKKAISSNDGCSLEEKININLKLEDNKYDLEVETDEIVLERIYKLYKDKNKNISNYIKITDSKLYISNFFTYETRVNDVYRYSIKIDEKMELSLTLHC